MLPEDTQLVSVNDHLVEPPDLWHAASARHAVPYVASGPEGESWRIGDWSMPVAGMGSFDADGRRISAASYAEMHPSLTQPGARLAAMDADSVEVQTIWPSVIGFAGERLRYLGTAEAWEAAVRAYNDVVIGQWCARTPARLVPVAIVPLHDGARAAAEAVRAAGLGARAVAFPHDPVAVDVASLYSGEWDPLFATLADSGLPVLVHIGKGVGDPEGQRFGSFGALLTDMNFDVLASLVDLVFSTTLVRHPRLKVAFIEGAAAWLPYLEERMDFFLKRDRVWDASLPKPSVLARRTSASFISDPNALRWRDQIGVGRLLWQSDFPHQDGFWPDSRSHLAAELADVADEDARRIAETNARALLGVSRRR